MKNLWISIKITLAMCVVLFVGYVLVLRLVAWVAYAERRRGLPR